MIREFSQDSAEPESGKAFLTCPIAPDISARMRSKLSRNPPFGMTQSTPYTSAGGGFDLVQLTQRDPIYSIIMRILLITPFNRKGISWTPRSEMDHLLQEASEMDQQCVLAKSKTSRRLSI